MHKFLTVSAMISSLFLSGCSQTTAFDFFSTDAYYEKAVSNMQKASLMRGMETKALLHAVYLNNVDPHIYHGDEYFYVAVHIIEDAYDPKKHGLKNLDYKLFLVQPQNGSEVVENQDQNQSDLGDKGLGTRTTRYLQPIDTQELDEDHKLRRTMPVRNQWNHYYLLRYKETNASKLELLFENDQYGKVLLSFQKEKQ